MSIPDLALAPPTYEMDSIDSAHRRPALPKTVVDKKEYTVGIIYLLTVVLLWTLANFITQRLFVNGYEKPFLITYLTTSAFSFYLVLYGIRHVWSKYKNDSSSISPREGYQPLVGGEATETHDNAEPPPSLNHLTRINVDDQVPERNLPPLDVRQTAELALAFCLLWFIANWSVNTSLSYTTVASATILASTSGFFTLGIGRIFRVEKLTAMKVTAVFICFLGVVLVSLSDSEERNAGEPPLQVGPLDASEWARGVKESSINTISKQISRPLFGDALALVSALFYAFYVILLKVRIKNEERIDMQLFFGFVGLFNILLCWPIGLILHWTHIEPFELPTKAAEWYTIICDMMITWLSDYLYVFAMLKTTPLVATVGLSLTIPAAVLGDTLLGVPVYLQVLIGATFVLVGFITIGADSKSNGSETPRQVRMD